MYRRVQNVVLASVISGLFAGQVWAQAAARVEYKFTSDQVLQYKISDKMSSSIMDMGDNGSSVVTEGVLKLQVVKILPDGSAEIRAAYDKGIVKAAGETKKLSADSVPTIALQVSKNGAIKNGDNLFQNAGWVQIARATEYGTETITVNVYASVLTAIFRDYPDRELKVGEIWKPATNQPSRFALAKPESKLVSVNTKPDGSVIALITTTGDQTEVSAPIESGGVYIGGITTRTVLNSKASFSITKGCIVNADDELQVTMSSNGSGTTTTMSTHVSLLPEAVAK